MSGRTLEDIVDEVLSGDFSGHDLNSACPHCSELALGMKQTNPDAQGLSPEPGQWCVCSECGGISRLDQELQLRRPNEGELPDPEVLEQLKKTQAIVRRALREQDK